MVHLKNKVSAVSLSLAVSMMFLAGAANAGASGSFMQNLATYMVGIMQGYVGTVIALGAIVVGLVAGIMKQSLGGFAIGLGIAIAAYYGPAMIRSITSALAFI